MCFCFPPDITPPTITGCRTTTITRPLPAQGMGTTVEWVEPTATDNSGLDITMTRSHEPRVFFFELGQHTVVYNFTDAFDNWDTCEFDIVITGKYRVSQNSMV